MIQLNDQILNLIEQKPGVLSGREVYMALVLLQSNPDLCRGDVANTIWKLIEEGKIKMKPNLKLEPGLIK